MTELTQEYLDKSLKNLPTKQDVKDAVEEGVEKLARIIVETVVEPMNNRFDRVETRLGRVETRMENVENRLVTVEQGQEEILLKLDNKVNKIDLPNFPKKINHQ